MCTSPSINKTAVKINTKINVPSNVATNNTAHTLLPAHACEDITGSRVSVSCCKTCTVDGLQQSRKSTISAKCRRLHLLTVNNGRAKF
jgi:hypothetical protein